MTALGQNSTGTIIADPSSGASVTLTWAAGTDVGNHRAANEDSYVLACPYFAVADGMGGHSAGDIASDCVVTSIATLETSGFAELPALEGALQDAVTNLKSKITEDQQGAGTTVTGLALMFEEGQLQWNTFNIGDSRVYVQMGEMFEQVTTDHSVVQQLVDAGTITKEEADYHPHANVITRAVGIMDEPVPDYVALPVLAGMRLLICSDGLTKELTDVGISHFLSNAPSPADAVTDLIAAALGNSGRDNVTIIVVDVVAVSEPA